MKLPRSALDDFPFPDKLDAQVVEPGSAPAIHGYAVFDDLALYYSQTELALLALTSQPPDEAVGRAATVALAFLAPAPINEAPTHAAMLTQLCGGEKSALVAVAALGLAEQAGAWAKEHQPLFDWLQSGNSGPFPEVARKPEQSAQKRTLIAALSARQADAICRRLLEAHEFSLMAACLAVLWHCGVKTDAQLITLLVSTRLPTAVAEALAHNPRAFKTYPMNLPAFSYRPPQRGSSDDEAS
jgi:hypothetical protein